MKGLDVLEISGWREVKLTLLIKGLALWQILIKTENVTKREILVDRYEIINPANITAMLDFAAFKNIESEEICKIILTPRPVGFQI